MPPLDRAGLDRIALHYVGRYATTRARLADYLRRKLTERGWSGEGAPPVDEVVERVAAFGYVDDRAFADARGRALARRGYGPRRIGMALTSAGIDKEDAAEARAEAESGAWAAAVAFARRKRLGPFAAERADPAGERRAFGAFIRAGHSPCHARRLLASMPGEVPEDDDGPR